MDVVTSLKGHFIFVAGSVQLVSSIAKAFNPTGTEPFKYPKKKLSPQRNDSFSTLRISANYASLFPETKKAAPASAKSFSTPGIAI